MTVDLPALNLAIDIMREWACELEEKIACPYPRVEDIATLEKVRRILEALTQNRSRLVAEQIEGEPAFV